MPSRDILRDYSNKRKAWCDRNDSYCRLAINHVVESLEGEKILHIKLSSDIATEHRVLASQIRSCQSAPSFSTINPSHDQSVLHVQQHGSTTKQCCSSDSTSHGRCELGARLCSLHAARIGARSDRGGRGRAGHAASERNAAGAGARAAKSAAGAAIAVGCGSRVVRVQHTGNSVLESRTSSHCRDMVLTCQ